MIEDDPGPLAQDLDALLDAERRYPDPPAQVRARVLARVRATMGGAPAAPMAGTATALAARPVVLALATFALGVATGIGAKAWIDRAPDPPAEPAPSTARPSRPEPPAPVASQSDPFRPPEVSLSPEKPPAVRPHAGRAAPVEDALEAERVVLQLARAHLAAGNGPAALQQIERHERAFPGGTLAEEREALAVKALLLTANHAAARTRAAEFRRHYPRSIYLPAVEQALESMP